MPTSDPAVSKEDTSYDCPAEYESLGRRRRRGLTGAPKPEGPVNPPSDRRKEPWLELD